MKFLGLGESVDVRAHGHGNVSVCLKCRLQSDHRLFKGWEERESESERAGYHQCVLHPPVGIAIGFLHRNFDGLGGESPFESALTISYAENEDILQPTSPISKILTTGPLSCSESHF